MGPRRGPPPRQLPPRTNTTAWACLLAAARGADQLQADNERDSTNDPLTSARLDALLPVARALYDKKVRKLAEDESERIETIIAHCHKVLLAKESRIRRESKIFKQRAAVPWKKERCVFEMQRLRVPVTLKTLRPVPPVAIGVRLVPLSSAWRGLRDELNGGLSDKDRRLRNLYHTETLHAISTGAFDQSLFEQLGTARFVDAVLADAPPLVRNLPPKWTSPGITDELIEALLALLQLGRTRPLVDLVKLVSQAEYNMLVKERSCLLQLLDGETWAPNCDNGRNLDDYKAFARILEHDGTFKGSLAGVPPNALAAVKSLAEAETLTIKTERLIVPLTLVPHIPERQSAAVESDSTLPNSQTRREAKGLRLKKDEPNARHRLRLRRIQDRHALQEPPQADTAAWMRMLAAARGADMIQIDGMREIHAHPLTKMRLRTLLPVANELYEERVRPTAFAQSQRIKELLVFCRDYLGAKDSWGPKLSQKQRVAELWSEEECEKQAQKLLVPVTLRTLRPAPPEVIGLHLVPQSSAWHLLRVLINRRFSKAERRLKKPFNMRLYKEIRAENTEQSELHPLRNVSFVDEVLKRAPPLVRALPPRWTSPDATDELLKAMLALVNFDKKRPLVDLVDRLSDKEHKLLADEHSCVSQILNRGRWPPNCANGRRLEDYTSFARFLQNDSCIEDSRARASGDPQMAKTIGSVAVEETQSLPVNLTDSNKRGRLRLGKVKDRRTLQVPPQKDTAAWMRMLAAARGADMIQTEGLEEIEAYPLTRLRLRTLLPVANALYEERARRTAVTESEKIDDIIEHCQEFLAAMESQYQEPDEDSKQRAAEAPDKDLVLQTWDEERCGSEVKSLLLPATFKSLRPVPPDAIGLHIIPRYSAWRMLRIVIHRGFSEEDENLNRAFTIRMNNEKRSGSAEPSWTQRLRNASFVDAVLERAPPLVRILPPRWTAAESTDELLQAMRALLQLGHTRPLAGLVKKLTEGDYKFLVDEHFCLSQLLDRGKWKPACSKGRRLDTYLAFADFLRNDGNFKGTLANVPLKDWTAKRTRDQSSDSESLSDEVVPAFESLQDGKSDAVHRGSGRLPTGTHKRQRLQDLQQAISSRRTGPSQASSGVAVESKGSDGGAQHFAGSRTSWSDEAARQIGRNTENAASESHAKDEIKLEPPDQNRVPAVVTQGDFAMPQTVRNVESWAPEDREHDLGGLLDLGGSLDLSERLDVGGPLDLEEPLDLDPCAQNDDELLCDVDQSNLPNDAAEIDPMDWWQASDRLPSELENVGSPRQIPSEPWDPFWALELPQNAARGIAVTDTLFTQGASAILRPELPALRSGEYQVSSSVATVVTRAHVVPVAAAVVVVVLLVGLVYRFRPRRGADVVNF